MGLVEKVCSWLGGGRTEVTVLVLGLDHSGKSSVLAALAPRHAGAAPPLAAHTHHFTSGGVNFRACDVSGAARHRALWEREYRGAHALMWVVDAGDRLRLVVAREELATALAHPDLARRLPLLVLANKSDAPHALAPDQLAAALQLDRLATWPWHVAAVSALSGAGLADGVAWLARQLRDQLTHNNHKG